MAGSKYRRPQAIVFAEDGSFTCDGATFVPCGPRVEVEQRLALAGLCEKAAAGAAPYDPAALDDEDEDDLID